MFVLVAPTQILANHLVPIPCWHHDWHARKYVGCGRWQLIQGSQYGTISRSCIKTNKESSRSKFLTEGRRLILRSWSGMMGTGWLTPPIPNIIGFLLSQTKTWETTVLDVVNFSLLSAPSKPWLTLVVCPQVVFAWWRRRPACCRWWSTEPAPPALQPSSCWHWQVVRNTNSMSICQSCYMDFSKLLQVFLQDSF